MVVPLRVKQNYSLLQFSMIM